MVTLTALEQEILSEMLSRRPELEPCVESLLQFHAALVHAYDNGNKLFICGNGGSNADALHIAGELCKSFERRRPVPASMTERLASLPFGHELSRHLEQGLPAIPLGLNSALKSAIENDSPQRDIAFAQELYALGKAGDVLLAISTSGNAANCLMAMSVSKASEMVTVSLTGPHGGKMATVADIAIRAPGHSTKTIQEEHIVLYHTFCAMIEVHYFPEKR